MEGKIEIKVSLLFKVFLYSSITVMILGKLIHGIDRQIGMYLVHGGVYLLVSCPILGLLTVTFDSFKHNRRGLLISSLLVTFLILISMVIIIIAG